MKICRKAPDEILEGDQSVIGFFGAPPKEELERASRRFPGQPFVDLDIFFDAPKTGLVSDAYCHIIRNCVDNAVMLTDKLSCVVAATGQEKCDAGRYAAEILRDEMGLDVISTTNEESKTENETLLCKAKGPLSDRVVRIMETVVEPLNLSEVQEAKAACCEATHGFWGTPPHPIQVLDLFPDTTHVFGWTRCVERGRPADLELEMEVDEGLPTVFFVQGFCAKSILARRLAKLHRGMLVDVHDSMGAATMAKIEAFIRLARRSD